MKRNALKLLLILLIFSFTGIGAFLALPIQASTTIPSGVVYYVPITLTNSQSNPVSGGTPISITINWSTYQPYLDNPVDNYVFFNNTGDSLFSWLENGTANTASDALVWVKLDSDGIPAYSNQTIYIGFYSTGSSQLGASGYTGESPTATGTYGQFDNGANVFSNYWNFAGTILPSDWNTYVGTDFTVNNGVTFSGRGPGNTAVIGTTATYPISNIVESNFQVTTATSGGMMYTVNPSDGAYSDSGDWVQMGISGHPNGCYNGQYFDAQSPWSGTVNSGTYNSEATGASTGSYTAGLVTPSASESDVYLNYTEVANSTMNVPPQGSYYIELGSTSAQFSLNWVRARTLPPNGVMPTSSVGVATSTTSASIPAPTLNPAGTTTAGTSVSLSVTVPGNNPAPTGTATFQTQIGGGSWTTIGSAVSLDNSGYASTSYMPMTAGSYQFQVIYTVTATMMPSQVPRRC